MPINLNQPEPDERHRSCHMCGKRKGLGKVLIHWPDEDCKKEEVRISTGMMVPAFSLWIYTCQWCRAIATKQRK